LGGRALQRQASRPQGDLFDRLLAGCSIKVDLPIPGSPPIKVTDPATNPPPSTRSSSADPVEMRGCSAEASAASEVGRSTRLERLAAVVRDPADRTSVTNVFHSPHPAHCPCHLAEGVPHDWHTKTSFTFAIGVPRHRFCELSIAAGSARSPILRRL
jgi:hypothetical protein